jgi:hypothetical protein
MGRTALPTFPCEHQQSAIPYVALAVFSCSSYWLGSSLPDLAGRRTPSTSSLILAHTLNDGNADGY